MKVDFTEPASNTKDDLLARLSEATEAKFEPVNPGGIQGEPLTEDFKAPNQNDFTPAPEPVEEIKQEQKEPEVKLPFSHYLNEAGSSIDFLDSLSKAYLPALYRKKLFSAEEYQEAKVLLEKVWNKTTTNMVDLSPREQYLADKMKQLDEMNRDIPLTIESKEVLKQPLAEVLQKYHGSVSPESKLLIAVAMVFGPKLMPLFA